MVGRLSSPPFLRWAFRYIKTKGRPSVKSSIADLTEEYACGRLLALVAKSLLLPTESTMIFNCSRQMLNSKNNNLN